VDSRALGGPARDAARAGGCPHPVPDELAKRLGVTEADAAAMVHADGGAAERVRSTGGALAPGARLPLFGHDGPNGASSAPRTRLSRRAIIAARKTTYGEKRAADQRALTILFSVTPMPGAPR